MNRGENDFFQSNRHGKARFMMFHGLAFWSTWHILDGILSWRRYLLFQHLLLLSLSRLAWS